MLYERYELNLCNYVIQITSSLQELKHVKRIRGYNYAVSREIQTFPGVCNFRLMQFKKKKQKNTRLNIK